MVFGSNGQHGFRRRNLLYMDFGSSLSYKSLSIGDGHQCVLSDMVKDDIGTKVTPQCDLMCRIVFLSFVKSSSNIAEDLRVEGTG